MTAKKAKAKAKTKAKGKRSKPHVVTPLVKQKCVDFSRRLEMLLGDRSQVEFAKTLGILQQNVSRYLTGGAPSFSVLVTLAAKEGVSLDWLIMGQGTMPKRLSGKKAAKPSQKAGLVSRHQKKAPKAPKARKAPKAAKPALKPESTKKAS